MNQKTCSEAEDFLITIETLREIQSWKDASAERLTYPQSLSLTRIFLSLGFSWFSRGAVIPEHGYGGGHFFVRENIVDCT